MDDHSMGTVFLICAAFIIIHTSMVSGVGKRAFRAVAGEWAMKLYYRLFFASFSAVLMMGAFFLIGSLPDIIILSPPAWFKWPMHLIQLSGMIFGMMSLRVMDAGEFFGVRQMRRRKEKGSLEGLSIDGLRRQRLVDDGVFAVVRHPIYLAGIIMISFQPAITYNRLVVTAVADLYFIYAAFKEERLLLRLITDEYREYINKVPMFNIFSGAYRLLR